MNTSNCRRSNERKNESKSRHFYKYAEKAADYFFKVDASKKKMLNKALWNDDKVDDNMFSFDVEDNDINPSSVILEYEGEP